MPDSPFQTKLFTSPEEYEETPLRDRKQCLPRLRHDDEKSEFIQDVIALANSARLFGRPAYLLFGLDNAGNACGVGETPEPYGPATDCRTWEQVRHEMGQAIRGYITPPLPEWELKHGSVAGQPVAYLLLHPHPSLEAFRVAKDFPRRGEKRLIKDQCWIRFGESKQEIDRREIEPDQAPYCYSYAQVPYLLPSMWRRYFDQVLTEPNIARDWHIPAYQELLAMDGRFLQEVIDGFLANDRAQLLIIRGAAGCGKSAFLRRLTARWAEIDLAAIQGYMEREEFAPPPGWIPVYFPLRSGEIAVADGFAQELLNEINRLAGWWAERPAMPERLFEQSDLHWLLCLDGLDEIWSFEGQARFVPLLRSFMRRFPRTKIVLTTRPDVYIPDDLGEIAEVRGFSDAQILAYIANFVGGSEPEQYERVVTFLQSEADLWRLCASPLYLEAVRQVLLDVPTPPLEEVEPQGAAKKSTPTVHEQSFNNRTESAMTSVPPVLKEELTLDSPITEEPENQEEQRDIEPEEWTPLNLGTLLDRVYSYLWKREVGRRPLPQGSSETWWEKTGQLAAQMDGHRQSLRRGDAQVTLGSEQALHWILSLGILHRRLRSGWLCFATELTKAYYAASFLRPFVEEEAIQEARQCVMRCSDEFKNRVRDLLQQITYADTEPIFQGGEP